MSSPWHSTAFAGHGAGQRRGAGLSLASPSAPMIQRERGRSLLQRTPTTGVTGIPTGLGSPRLDRIGFRWRRVRRKYGILDLHFWAGYVVFSFALVSTLVEFATLVLWRE